jgi:hypothetical protein
MVLWSSDWLPELRAVDPAVRVEGFLLLRAVPDLRCVM